MLQLKRKLLVFHILKGGNTSILENYFPWKTKFLERKYLTRADELLPGKSFLIETYGLLGNDFWRFLNSRLGNF